LEVEVEYDIERLLSLLLLLIKWLLQVYEAMEVTLL